LLYVSSRNKSDSYTAYTALHNNYTPDGGLFIPFHLPQLSEEEIANLRSGSFAAAVARILNLFFSSGLSEWDVECCIGRAPVRLQSMSHKLIFAECWHNVQRTYAYTAQQLFSKIAGQTGNPSKWAQIAIRIAILFGIYSQMSDNDAQGVDIAVNTGDFSQPMAAWYAKKMGLPVGTIICSCNDNCAVWDLLRRGECATGTAVIPTELPELDFALPECVEMLIAETLGCDEVQKYLQAVEKKATYRIDEEMLAQFNAGLVCVVVSQSRIPATLRSLYRANAYIADSYSALSFGGLQDHRASSGESRSTVLFSDYCPVLAGSKVAKAIGITNEALILHINSPKE